MNPFHELETPISDTAMAAQILASLFEDVHADSMVKNRQITMTEHEVEMLSFMIYDMCRRTGELRKAFQSAHDIAQQAKGGGK